MGVYVHLHVCFACDQNEPVAAIAKKHLTKELEDECREAAWFLTDLSKRTGRNPGPKGGLSMWGIIGNYTRGQDFVDALMPFWSELLSDKANDNAPFSFEHILVFVEPEQSEQATAFEIFRAEPRGSGEILVQEHKCQFAWMQM